MSDLKAFISACAALIYCAIIIITFKFNHLLKSSSCLWGEKANKKASKMGCVGVWGRRDQGLGAKQQAITRAGEGTEHSSLTSKGLKRKKHRNTYTHKPQCTHT